MSTLIPQTIPSKRLAASINASSNTIQLNNILGWDGEDLAPGDFGDLLFAVLRNDQNTAMEIMLLDPATIADSEIDIVKRGLKFDGDLTTEVTANKLPWVKNETIVELGTDTPQIFQWLKEYIDAVAIAGSVPASETTTGIVEEGTQAEVDAGTATGGTGSRTFLSPAKLRSKKKSDYVSDTGSANAYVIAPSPAITAYTVGQEFVFKAVNANNGDSTLNVNSLGVKTIKKDSTGTLVTGDILAGQIVHVIYDGTYFQLMNKSSDYLPATSNRLKLGGTGADGALNLTSGPTNIDLGGAAVVVKNYTSISITGTGQLTFSNPNTNGTLILLKSQGDVTITSSASPAIDARGMGAAAGNNGRSTYGFVTTAGSAGAAGSPNVGGAAGSALFPLQPVQFKHIFAACGSGGGSGAGTNGFYLGAGGGGGASAINSGNAGTGGNYANATSTSSTGGRGGPVLMIECRGAWNVTSVVAVNGNVGQDATSSPGCGAGGGGGGTFIGRYGTLTANSGVHTYAGGAGGAGAGGGFAGGSGGAGYTDVAENTEIA